MPVALSLAQFKQLKAGQVCRPLLSTGGSGAQRHIVALHHCIRGRQQKVPNLSDSSSGYDRLSLPPPGTQPVVPSHSLASYFLLLVSGSKFPENGGISCSGRRNSKSELVWRNRSGPLKLILVMTQWLERQKQYLGQMVHLFIPETSAGHWTKPKTTDTGYPTLVLATRPSGGEDQSGNRLAFGWVSGPGRIRILALLGQQCPSQTSGQYDDHKTEQA